MNKKKFLKILEEKLQILSEEERKDILNEYKDTIEEKIRHGSSEEEAVADFGSVEELSREILKAYKINPDYSNGKDKVKEFVEEGESLIKKGAEKLSGWTQDAIEDFKNNDQNWTLEMVFEVIIKAIILLIGLSLLRIPFYLIESLGLGIFEVAFPPFDSIFKIILKCFTSFIYLIVCIIIAMIVFKPYFITNKQSAKKKESKSKEVKIEKENEHQTTKESGGFKIALEILKAFLFLCTVFPLYFVDFGCYIALAVLLFLLIEGVPILGVFLMLLGIAIFLTFLTKVFYNLLYGNKKIYCYSLIISAIVFVSGCFFSIGTLADFEVYRGLPDNSFTQKEFVYEKNVISSAFHISNYDYEVKEDNSLEDNQVQIIVSYYSDFISEVNVEEKELDGIIFYRLKAIHQNVSRASRRKVYNMIMRELKNLRWYHYNELGDLKIIVKANSDTIAKMK
ncbi:MAG: DUF1700 domain-containing protein [Bacilli bacterium]|nr:DUF1700 domain-containing protein [Bacilli bacterium]